MQIVIDIPRNVYDTLQQFPDDQLNIENAIKYGVPFNSVIEDIKAEIVEYKDDKVIHVERNEMIDIVLEIIDRRCGKEN